MTEGHETTEDLRKQIASLEAELSVVRQDLESFNYSVTHDLRAPLRAITAFADAVAEDYSEKLGAQGVDYLQRVRSSAAFMEQLLDSLLELSRVSRAAVRREPVDLTALARSVAAEVRQSNPERDVEFVIAENLTVRGDPALLKICLQHLMDNAFKFTSRVPSARIEVGAARTGAGVAQTILSEHQDRTDRIVCPTGVSATGFFVRDNGAGFNQEFSDKMFGAFQRLHSQTEFEGLGIGLTVVQRIVHKHGGHIRAEGKPGQGASVIVQLP